MWIKFFKIIYYEKLNYFSKFLTFKYLESQKTKKIFTIRHLQNQYEIMSDVYYTIRKEFEPSESRKINYVQ